MSEAPKPLDLVLTQKAERDLLAMAHDVRQRVKADVLRLAEGTIPHTQLKKLQGVSPAVWQLTSGEFRVFYRRTSEQFLILRAVHKPSQQRVLRTLR